MIFKRSLLSLFVLTMIILSNSIEVADPDQQRAVVGCNCDYTQQGHKSND